jgi:hypothetical protein
MSAQNKTQLDPKTRVEVVMRKNMNIIDYNRIMKEGKAKGWTVQAYQIGVYSIGCKKIFD